MFSAFDKSSRHTRVSSAARERGKGSVMIYGVYLSAQGANVQTTRLDVISNNLANASTNSFKRDLAVFREHNPHDVEHGTANDLPGNLNQVSIDPILET